MAELTGGCGCGAVRFEISEPLTAAAYCHCTRCQVRTGTRRLGHRGRAEGLADPAQRRGQAGRMDARRAAWRRCSAASAARTSSAAGPAGEIIAGPPGRLRRRPRRPPAGAPVRRLRGELGGHPRRRAAPLRRGHTPAVRVSASYEERYWYPDDGGIVWLAGYTLVDPETGAFLARDAPQLAERGLRVAAVAGARFNPEALQSDEAAPGRRLVLRPDPEQPARPQRGRRRHRVGRSAGLGAEGDRAGGRRGGGRRWRCASRAHPRATRAPG